MKKIIIYNLIVLFSLFCILEFVSYLYVRYDAGDFLTEMKKIAKIEGNKMPTQRYAPVKLYEQSNYGDYYRKTLVSTNKNSKKGSVLFFGCSYTYGSYLDENETISAVVNKKTGRTTINRGMEGGGIYNTIYDLKNEKFYEDIPQAPEYIVYTFINDHLNRISIPYKASIIFNHDNPVYYLNFGYKEENGELVENRPSKFILPFYALYTVKAWHYLYSNRFAHTTKEEKMLSLLNATKKITDSKFPTSKFVIIDYKDGGRCLMQESLKQNLIKNGFIIYHAEELAGHELDSEKWRGPDKEHPSAAAIEDVANGLIKNLNL